ncbi:GNAT family N-acetyltransferase [Dysgonomonas sp. 520]|uniref:GNAT family N-acetyltransferase n=1 Tax=Dysgonomonas sp. 520 TaxID=2302931 RepID=UPI0013CF72C8|nr:GNAT family N-acetyltransferase [Dysgonomonas sp. 520]NDW10563.1 N-acetyltransferase [Dysgonomonas sp. 520]
MKLKYQENCENIPWKEIPLLLEKVGMSFTGWDVHKTSFESSHSVLFLFNETALIGFGRMISDGIRQSALYDIAIEPGYQGRGLGREIVLRLMAKTPGCNFILYASPGKEDFYKKLNYKRMKTGMALFANPDRMEDDIFVENE